MNGSEMAERFSPFAIKKSMGILQKNEFEIDLRSATIRLRTNKVLGIRGDDLRIRFKSKTAHLHLGIMALVARDHKSRGNCRPFQIKDHQPEIEKLASLFAQKSGFPLRNLYGTIRVFWKRNCNLYQKNIELSVDRKSIDSLPQTVKEAFETLLMTQGSPSLEVLKLNFNKAALDQIGISPADFMFTGLEELLAGVDKKLAASTAIPVDVATSAIIPSEEGKRIKSGDQSLGSAATSSTATDLTTSDSAGDLTPGKPEYRFNLGLTDLASLPDVDNRAGFTFPLITLATLAGRLSDRDRLISDLTLKISSLHELNNIFRAEDLFRIAKYHALMGNTIASRAVIGSFCGLPEEIFRDLGIWENAPEGVFAALLESFATGYIKAKKNKEAMETLLKLRCFAKRRAFNLSDKEQWQPSEAFISLKCKMKAVDEALEHFKWMCKHGYHANKSFDGTLIGLSVGFMNQERWNEAVALLQDYEKYLADDVTETSLWLTWLLNAPPKLPLNIASRIVDGISNYIAKEPLSYERAGLLAKLARACAKQKMIERYNAEMSRALYALDDLLKGDKSSDRWRWLKQCDGELHVRLELACAYLKADNQTAAQGELAKILKINQQLLDNGIEKYVSAVSNLLATFSRIDEAVELTLHGIIPFFRTSIFKKLLDEKEFQKLRRLYDSMATIFFKGFFFRELTNEFERRSLNCCEITYQPDGEELFIQGVEL